MHQRSVWLDNSAVAAGEEKDLGLYAVNDIALPRC